MVIRLFSKTSRWGRAHGHLCVDATHNAIPPKERTEKTGEQTYSFKKHLTLQSFLGNKKLPDVTGWGGILGRDHSHGRGRPRLEEAGRTRHTPDEMHGGRDTADSYPSG